MDLITALLQAATRVRILVTSRERLNLHEEWVLDIRGLAYPRDEVVDPMEDYSAVQLFLQRARRVRADFQFSELNRSDVIRICWLVEGIPLGVELAASWVRVLSCQAIADEIGSNLDFLSTSLRNVPESHRSMRAVFARSYELLIAEEQLVFNRLSVFRGGFQREAAAAITGASLETLAALVDKSLLRVSAEGRYDIHELLRQYGDEQIEASGTAEAIREAHSGYYADFIHQRVEDLKGRRQLEALAEVGVDCENVIAAWNWAAEHRHKAIIEQMLEGLWLFGELRNRYHTRFTLFRYAEQQFAAQQSPELRRVWGRLLSRSLDTAADSRAQFETALQIAQCHQDDLEIAYCLNRLGFAVYANRDYASIQLLEQSLTRYRHLGDQYYVADALFHLMTADYEGSWFAFERRGQESLRLRREIGDHVGTLWSLGAVALSEARAGHYAAAETLFQERISLGQAVGALHLVALGYAHLSYQVYFVHGDFSQAQAAAEEALKIATERDYADAAGWALVTLGLLASMDDRYQDGNALCQQGASSGFLADIADYAAWGSSIAACGSGDYETAVGLFPAALKYGQKTRGLVGIANCLPVAALILAHQGDRVQAVELLGLAFTHPVRASGWMEKWSQLTRFRADLEASLGDDAYSAAWGRGTLLDAELVAAALQEQFQATAVPLQEKANPPHFADGEARFAADGFRDLTAREREVLELIAQGLSNTQIAQELVLSPKTVRNHITNIFSKMQITSRAQAIVQSRDAGFGHVPSAHRMN